MPCRRALWCGLVALLLCAPALAAADDQSMFDDGWTPEDPRAYSAHYQGMFTEIGARYGLLLAPSERDLTSISVHGRFAFPMSLGDMRLSYDYKLIGEGARAHQVGAHLAFHPLYLFMLGSDWLSYAIGGFYIDGGVGPHLALSSEGNALSALLSFGAGVDVPLWATDHGQAPWLNVSYQRHSARYARGDDRLATHHLLVGLAWRWNRLPF